MPSWQRTGYRAATNCHFSHTHNAPIFLPTNCYYSPRNNTSEVMRGRRMPVVPPINPANNRHAYLEKA